MSRFAFIDFYALSVSVHSFSSLKAKGYSEVKTNGDYYFKGFEYSGKWHNETTEHIERTATKISTM